MLANILQQMQLPPDQIKHLWTTNQGQQSLIDHSEQ